MIGIYDSGIGGLTVLHEIKKLLPQESLMYYADSRHFPYGDKTREQIIGYSTEIVKMFEKAGADMVVAACNTSSAYAINEIKDKFNFPLVGMIEPGAFAAVAASKCRRIGVIATEGTVNSGSYGNAIRRLAPDAEVIEIATPLFAPMVEAGQLSGADVQRKVNESLKGFMDSDNKCKVDTLVLGCTHYPYLIDVIKNAIGDGVSLVDPAHAVALEVQKILG